MSSSTAIQAPVMVDPNGDILAAKRGDRVIVKALGPARIINVYFDRSIAQGAAGWMYELFWLPGSAAAGKRGCGYRQIDIA